MWSAWFNLFRRAQDAKNFFPASLSRASARPLNPRLPKCSSKATLDEKYFLSRSPPHSMMPALSERAMPGLAHHSELAGEREAAMADGFRNLFSSSLWV